MSLPDALPPTLHAPEINRADLRWLNVDAPLSLESLKGKLVVLDFWTLCCINCIQIIPTLRRAEELFPDELVVIGVHSPKFEAEKDFENVKNAVARYGIRHPIIHDPNHTLWQAYGVHAWPTMIFIDPAGRIIGSQAGEPDALQFMNGIRDTLDHYEEKGLLAPKAFPLPPIPQIKSTLSFPGKIKPLPGPEKRWIVADSGHNQIVVFDDQGKEQERYGSGKSGFEDGPAKTASFNSPQGLIADENAIYVADTSNHAIRRIDRATGAVARISGTGERGHLLLNKFEKASTRALASPWDLEIKGNILFFANAGTHQIGGIDLEQNVLRVIAGNGSENIRDGNPLMAELAQTSALAFNSSYDKLYFCDSETSSLRYIDMKESQVRTLIGTGLFDFGHRNGRFSEARLQHALGLCLASDDHILVADSYNAVLRDVALAEKTVDDLAPAICLDPVCLPYGEPAGIWADGPSRLLLSDTNNHRIVEIDRTNNTTKTWA
jgi:thiol-disulfide isomerase/thioredoxin